MDEFKKNSRYRPNTAFQKYVGKPAFANYGNANTKTQLGGINYGDYMMTHNINPHRLSNNPTHPQVYETVEREYERKNISNRATSYAQERKNV